MLLLFVFALFAKEYVVVIPTLYWHTDSLTIKLGMEILAMQINNKSDSLFDDILKEDTIRLEYIPLYGNEEVSNKQ